MAHLEMVPGPFSGDLFDFQGVPSFLAAGMLKTSFLRLGGGSSH